MMQKIVYDVPKNTAFGFLHRKARMANIDRMKSKIPHITSVIPKI